MTEIFGRRSIIKAPSDEHFVLNMDTYRDSRVFAVVSRTLL